MAELVVLEQGGDLPDGVAVLRLNRPPVNALSTELHQDLREVVAGVAADPSIRAVIVWGGQKVFAAGADIKEFARTEPAEMADRVAALSASLATVAQLPQPVIAAVTGFALGGGCELALTADFRISAEDAKWGQPEILLGIIPGAGGTQRLTRLVGPARAKDLIFTGRMVDAEEALEIGLVDLIVEPDAVYATALAMAAKFAKGPALALRAAKAAIDGGLDGSLADGLRLESELFAQAFADEDRAIGIASFLEHGPGRAAFTTQPPTGS